VETAIKAQALGLGFDLVGITRTGPADTAEHFDRWLADGHAGTMSYMERHADIRRDTRRPFERGASAIVVALNYGGKEPTGPVARYARGDDYHDVMWRKLDALHSWMSNHLGHQISGRGFVDTGPLLERDLARRAGLGWFGKNTNLINPKLGSFFFLGPYSSISISSRMRRSKRTAVEVAPGAWTPVRRMPSRRHASSTRHGASRI
jgi:epoxyqueuosine reductase